ncbi:MAG: hypothetical protein M1438_12850 [Deltaproteobacteria bacterium]|nr:hypothetical protein [Deltaproteobacteria bacterium]
MSERFSLPQFFIPAALCLALFSTPQNLRAQGWTGTAGRQLQGLTGAHLNKFTYHGMPKVAAGGVPTMPASMGGMMMMSGLLSVAMQGLMDAASNAQVRAQRQAQYQEMQRWMAQEQERLAELVARQRAKRDREDQADMDELAKAMSAPWDGGKAPSDLASALRDPVASDSRPQGTAFFGLGGESKTGWEGESKTVDLRDRTRDTPEIPSGKKPIKPATGPIQQTETGRKLQKMIRENQDPAKLDANLNKLENLLSQSQERAEKIKQVQNLSPQDLQAWDRCVALAAQEGMLRGLSLAMDFRGAQDLINWYKGIKKNPARMDQLLKALNNINEFAEFADHYDKFELGELKDIIWNEANRNLMNDLEFFRRQNAVNHANFEFGKNIINDSVALAQGREELGKIEVRVKIEGLSPFFWDRKKQLEQQARKLAETARGARQELALKRDLAVPPDRSGQASRKPEALPSRASSLPVMKNLRVIPLDLKQPAGEPAPIAKTALGEPSVPGPKYHRVVFQGVVGARQEDQALTRAIQNDVLFQNPDRSYVFAFSGGPQSDRLMHHPETNPGLFFRKCPEIKNMEVEDLVFNHNSTPMVEMLVRQRFIKVKNLVFISNDTSRHYPKLQELMTLAKERGIMFNWYLNRQGKLVNFVSPSGVNPDLMPLEK